MKFKKKEVKKEKPLIIDEPMKVYVNTTASPTLEELKWCPEKIKKDYNVCFTRGCAAQVLRSDHCARCCKDLGL